ncbi:MAG: Hsp20/alpha crystallin family protein [Candidatus Acidiferrales bacterium]
MTVDDSLWVGADVAIFEEGTIEIWVGPRQITICGKPKVDKVDAARKQTRARPDGKMVFRVLDLAVEVDPSRVTTRFNGPSLEVLLRKTQARSEQELRAAAAQPQVFELVAQR